MTTPAILTNIDTARKFFEEIIGHIRNREGTGYHDPNFDRVIECLEAIRIVNMNPDTPLTADHIETIFLNLDSIKKHLDLTMGAVYDRDGTDFDKVEEPYHQIVKAIETIRKTTETIRHEAVVRHLEKVLSVIRAAGDPDLPEEPFPQIICQLQSGPLDKVSVSKISRQINRYIDMCEGIYRRRQNAG